MGYKIVKTIKPANILGEASLKQVEWLIRRHSKPECHFVPLDNKYRLTSKEEIYII